MTDPWVVAGVVVGLVAAFAAWRAWRIAARADARSLENNDTVWVMQPAAEGWLFEQLGSVPVQQVKIVLSVDRESEVTELERVAPSSPVLASSSMHRALLSQAAKELAENEAENDERSRPVALPSGFGGTIPMPGHLVHGSEVPYFGISNVEVSAVVTWRSPSGAPRSQSLQTTESYFGDEEYV